MDDRVLVRIGQHSIGLILQDEIAAHGVKELVHGRAHFFIGGDVQKTTSAPNDPVFFLLHSEVDRVWAAWQEDNLQSGDPKRMADHSNPGFPSDYTGSLFNFSEAKASDVFDYKALGYEYDTLPAKQ